MIPVISIIIPIYNAEKTLMRCIDSVLNQTYNNWELLLVDDGSIDKSALICDSYAQSDNRIRVFHKINAGVSSARNIGLENAKGEWITFIDSDDCVKDVYLENLLGHVKKSIDLVISFAEIHGKGFIRKENYPTRLITQDCFDILFTESDMYWHTSPWSKLYRRKIIRKNNLSFCVGMHIGEDALFLYSYMLYSHEIYVSSDTDYCYYACNENSLTKRINSLSSEILSYKNIEYIVNRLINERNIRNIEALNRLNWLKASYLRRILNSLYHNDIERTKRLQILKSIDWNLYIQCIGKISYKEKILKFMLNRNCLCMYDFFRILSVKIKSL